MKDAHTSQTRSGAENAHAATGTNTRIIQVREDLLQKNAVEAEALRSHLTDTHTRLVNIMSSPGAGKTSLILATVARLRDQYRIAVVEADLDSTVDADKFTAVGIPAVQIETGGFCHVEASMMKAAVAELDLADLDLVFLENVGNLICTAQSDTGAHTNVAILSVPEGDDKPLKYPIMFAAAEAVILNKMDYLGGDGLSPGHLGGNASETHHLGTHHLGVAEFDVAAFKERVAVLNPKAPVFEVSCKTGDGLQAWIDWLVQE